MSAGVMVLARYWTEVDGNDSSHSSGCPAVLAFSSPDHRAAGDLSREHVLFVIFKKREENMSQKSAQCKQSARNCGARLAGKKGAPRQPSLHQDKRKVCKRVSLYAPITAAPGVNTVPVTKT